MIISKALAGASATTAGGGASSYTALQMSGAVPPPSGITAYVAIATTLVAYVTLIPLVLAWA